MKTTHIDPSGHEAGWFYAKYANAPRDDFRDLDPVLPPRRPRQRAVKAIGVLCIVGLSGFVGWMAATTVARGPITDWGTLSSAVQPRLNAASPLADELSEQRARADEEALESPMITWAMGPAIAIADPARAVTGETDDERVEPSYLYSPPEIDLQSVDPTVKELWDKAEDL